MNKIMNLPLTEREEEVLAYILGYVVDYGYSPTRQEIGDRFNITPQGAQKFVRGLIDKGRIKVVKQRGKKRSFRNIVIVENSSLQ